MDNSKECAYCGYVLQLSELYFAVKYAIICAENFDPKRELYIAPLNELRSALDHFFKAASAEQNMEDEMKKAKEHMTRAGYDALEILAGNVGNEILKKMKPYPTSAIASIFPEYYTTLCPKISDVRIDIAEIRMRPKSHSEKSFLEYLGDIKELLAIDKKVTTILPSLENYCVGIGKEKRLETALKIGIPILTAIIGVVLGFVLTKWFG